MLDGPQSAPSLQTSRRTAGLAFRRIQDGITGEGEVVDGLDSRPRKGRDKKGKGLYSALFIHSVARFSR